MKNLTLWLALLLCAHSNCFAQVGIGTSAPDASSILDIQSIDKGILVPRLSNTQIGLIANPATGLLVYNTDLNEFQFNCGIPASPDWAKTSHNMSVKYSNSNTTTNINVASAIDLPIFGNTLWNDDTTLYSVSGNTVTINSTGRYRITVNIFYSAPNFPSNNTERRISVLAQLAIGGTGIGTIAATGYIRHDDNHDEASLNFTDVIEITTGQSLSVQVFRGGNSANAFLDSNGSSNITIEKIN